MSRCRCWMYMGCASEPVTRKPQLRSSRSILLRDDAAGRFVPAIKFPAMQLVDLFASSLVGQADEVAIEFERANGRLATLRFGDLNARSNRLAHLLTRRGLQAGDRL